MGISAAGTLLRARASTTVPTPIRSTITAWNATDQPGYGLLNAGLAFTSTTSLAGVLDGENLTNKYYRVAGYEFGPPPLASPPLYSFVGGVSELGFYGPPRTWGLTVQYHY